MVINLQGIEHFQKDINYQDLAAETPKFILVLDGCTGINPDEEESNHKNSTFSEVGTRMFAQLFSSLPNFDNLEKFEENVKYTFDKMIKQLKEWYSDPRKLDKFIDRNLLFTILVCFDTDDAYIVKTYGDGYIITINSNNDISYIRLNYGKASPYYAYKYCSYDVSQRLKEYEFKTYTFSKEKFNSVGIATDGIKPIDEYELRNYDKLLIRGASKERLKTEITMNRNRFYDDVTIGIFNNGGKVDEKNT